MFLHCILNLVLLNLVFGLGPPDEVERKKRKRNNTDDESNHDASTQRITRQMSKSLSSATKHNLSPSKGSVPKKTVVAAKRAGRLNSAPCRLRQAVVVLSPIKETGEKQKRATKKRDTAAVPNDSNDNISSLIAMNCKLTFEVLDTKKTLSEKNNALLKIQKNYFESQLEVIALQKSNTEKDQQIDMLLKQIERLKAERFCSDLISFDEVFVDNPENITKIHSQDLLGSILEPQEEANIVVESTAKTNTNLENTKFQWTPID